jgi:hypothetical protein
VRHGRQPALLRKRRRGETVDGRNQEAQRLSRKAIREFSLDGGKGIRIGDPLTHFQGILTGAPIFEGSQDEILKAVEMKSAEKTISVEPSRAGRQRLSRPATPLVAASDERVMVIAPVGADASAIATLLSERGFSAAFVTSPNR